MKKILSLIFILSIFLNACDSNAPKATDAPTETSTEAAAETTEEAAATNVPIAFEEVTLGAGHGARSSFFEVYFTDPQSSLAAQKTGGPDGPLVDAIDAARLSVDVAIYSLSLNSVRNALIDAHNRGVRVRMVMESENMERSDPQKIKDAGIPILGDRREGLMHNKFVIIDSSEVWLGSMNFTDSGAYEDNNHIIRIRSKELAADYTKEFEEMFTDDLFGSDVAAETPYPHVNVNGTPIDVYFSPDDGAQENLLPVLEGAQENIFFMAFSFTADKLGDALRARSQEGVVVYGVMEEEQVNSNAGTEYDAFKQAGVRVRIDGNDGQMHHKVMIVDESIVVLGSYNFTDSAEKRNDENLLIIYSKDLAAYFVDEFNKMYEEGK